MSIFFTNLMIAFCLNYHPVDEIDRDMCKAEITLCMESLGYQNQEIFDFCLEDYQRFYEGDN